MNAVDKLGGILGGTKAPGESASVIATGSMDIAVAVMYGDQACE